MYKNTNLKVIHGLSFVIVGLIGVVAYVQSVGGAPLADAQAGAQSNSNVSGFMWSETVGWISMNSASDGSNVSYGVSVDTSNFAAGGVGAFSGYAWSENVGWITFDAVQAGTPPGAPSHMAQVDWNTGKVTGWARALSAVGRTDGWDGWIKFSKDPGDVGPDYGATINKTTGTMTGYAWGSDVVGWIDVGAGSKPATVDLSSIDSGAGNTLTCRTDQTLINGVCVDNSGSGGGSGGDSGTGTESGTGTGGGSGSGGGVNYTVGDGACDASKGETVFNSPVDCGPKGVKQF